MRRNITYVMFRGKEKPQSQVYSRIEGASVYFSKYVESRDLLFIFLYCVKKSQYKNFHNSSKTLIEKSLLIKPSANCAVDKHVADTE